MTLITAAKETNKRADDAVFNDLPKISDHFTKISEDFLKLFRRPDEHLPNSSENFTKITEDCRRRPKKTRRCFDCTPTNSSVVEGTRQKCYQTYLDCLIFSKLDSLPIFKGKFYLKLSKLILNWTVLKIKQ